jgi:hypothetical protein
MQTRALRLLAVIGTAIAFIATASGCCRDSQRPRAAHTVDQYRAKPDLLEEKLRECANNPGELRDTPDCINANAASGRRGMESMNRGMGPLNNGMGSMNGAGPSKDTQ